jgi:hypothetical protein
MSAIVNSGRVYIAAKAAVPAPVEITHFVLANIVGLVYTDAVDLDEVMPDVGDIVATLPVSQSGYVSDSKVVYSLIMNSSVGPFEFNWIGLKSATGELIAVQYSPLVYKLKTAGGILGNNMTRNFMLSFDNAQSLTEIALEVEPWQISNHLIEADETITVGTGGDYATINEALEVISRKIPIYTNAGITVTINLLAGFVMAESVIVDGINLSFVTITGVDSSTSVNRSALTDSMFIAQNGGSFPLIDQLFDMDSSGATARRGLVVTGAGSNCRINTGAGIKNSIGVNGGNCFAFLGGVISGSGCVFSGGYYGVLANRGGCINLENTDLSGCNSGAVASYGGIISAEFSNFDNCAFAVSCNSGSRMHINGSTANNCTNDAIVCGSGGILSAHGISATGCGGITLFCQGGHVIIHDSDLSGAATRGIYVTSGGWVNAHSTNAQKGGSPVSTDMAVIEGSWLNANGATGGISITANTPVSAGIIIQ